MIIEIINNPVHEEIKFEDLEPGVVFEFDGGKKVLKLEQNKYVILTYSSGDDWFAVGGGGARKYEKITKVWGKLVGLKTQL